MAFGILVVGMIMGLMAAIVVVPSDAGLLMAAASYIAFGSLTLVSVVLFAAFKEAQDDEREYE